MYQLDRIGEGFIEQQSQLSRYQPNTAARYHRAKIFTAKDRLDQFVLRHN